MDCCSPSMTWSKKRKTVPDLNLVHNPVTDHLLVDNHILDFPTVYNHVPVVDCQHPLVYHQFIDNPHYVLPTVKTLLDLPYHIIIDILIRLPAECVLRCRRASRLLEILVTTPSFVRTHLARHATSVVALQSFSKSSDRELRVYFYDERAEKAKKASLKLHFHYSEKDYPVMLYDSYDGFILLQNKKNSSKPIFIVWNPTTSEQVTITMESRISSVCGFYFNTHNKEYEMLLVYREGERYAFCILTLGSKVQKNIGRYPYMPRSERPPTIINGTLYWMVEANYGDHQAVADCSNSIMGFETGTSKFSTMGHGGAPCGNAGRYGCINCDDMQLIEMEGQLGLCVFLPIKKILVVWVLNPATNSWVNTHNVTLPEYSRPEYFSCWPNSLHVEVVKMKDRRLLLDLDLRTFSIVKKKGFEDDNFRLVMHTQSLVSLDTNKLIRLGRP